MIYRYTRGGSPITLETKIYPVAERDRERRMCTRRSRRALWRSQSGCCCSVGPLSALRASVRPIVATPPRARGGERENKNGRENRWIIGGDRGREGSFFLPLSPRRKGKSIFRKKETGKRWLASLVSRDPEPIVSVFA